MPSPPLRRLPRGVQVQAVAPAGVRVPAWLVPWKRWVYASVGEVGQGAPIVVTGRRGARAVARQIRGWGYSRVELHRRG